MASPEIEALTQALARLPGLGPRSARRAVLHLLKKREAALGPLLAALEAVERNARHLLDLRQCRHHRSRAASAPTRAATHRACAWSRKSPTCGRSTARGCFRAATMCLAGDCRRSKACGPRIWHRRAGPPDRGGRDRRGRAGDERHAGGPDHRALYRRADRALPVRAHPARARPAGRRRARLSR